MTWRGRTTALELKTIDELRAYMRSLNYNNWRPSGQVLHNTASPNIQQWYYGSTSPEQRMENLKSYYANDMGWSAGPHAFISPGWEGPPAQPPSIWVMTDFNVQGVHSPSWNGTRLGFEMVGDYDVESDETGLGAKVMELAVALFGETSAYFGWEVNNEKIKLHKEDPNTSHDCPGANVVKQEFLDDVTNYMGDGGDHGEPDQPQPTEVAGVVYNLTAGDALNIRASASSSAPVIGTADNGDEVVVVQEAYNGSTRWFRIRFGNAEGAGVAVYGWASASYIKRADAPAPDDELWRENITATVFASPDDPQDSAYGTGPIDGKKPGCSVPYKWYDEPPPSLFIQGPHGEQVAPTVDRGPWNYDDPRYVIEGTARPMVEKQYALGIPAENGMVPTNDAAIDLTPNTAAAVGISGKGKVRWRYATANDAPAKTKTKGKK